jgi:nucleoside-diphosphate-sugar epimerase
MFSAPVIVTGASGFLGSHVREVLADAAPEVVIVSRKQLSCAPHERLVCGDLRQPDGMARSLPASGVVLNLAYDPRASEDGNIELAQGVARLCMRLSATRLVHVSTAMVTGLVSERFVSETTACRPVSSYQKTKLDVEETLRGMVDACPLVILRPAAIFGRGGRNLEKLAADLVTRPWYENYARSCLFGARPMNLVPVETVAAAVIFAAVSDVAVRDGLYLVADDESRGNNFRDIEAVLRQAFGLGRYPLPAVPLPRAALIAALKAAGRLSFDPRTQFSSARLSEAGFVRPVTFDDALVRYAADKAAAMAGPR